MRPEGTPDFPVHSGRFHRCHPHPARCAGFYRQDKTQRCKRVTARRRASFPVNGLCRQPEICMGKKKPWKLRHTLRLSVTSLPRFNRRGSGRVVGNWLGLQISKPDDKHGNANWGFSVPIKPLPGPCRVFHLISAWRLRIRVSVTNQTVSRKSLWPSNAKASANRRNKSARFGLRRVMTMAPP